MFVLAVQLPPGWIRNPPAVAGFAEAKNEAAKDLVLRIARLEGLQLFKQLLDFKFGVTCQVALAKNWRCWIGNRKD
jgi:hypothetical protein